MTNLFPIWKPSPSRINNSNLTHFQNYLNQNYQLNFSNYQELHRWSVEHREIFWPAVAAFCKLDFSESISPDGVPSGTMFPRAKWFPNCELNFAQALMPLRDNSTAIIEISEDGKKQKLSFKELHTAVANVTAFLKAHGVAPLDTVAGYLPNITSTVIAMLATTSIGAIWSSCSPDFGVKAVVDRFAQIKPKVLFTVDSYQYNGKLHDNKSRLESIASALTSLKAIVLCGENQTTPFQYNSLFQFDNISSQKKTAGNSFPKLVACS